MITLPISGIIMAKHTFGFLNIDLDMSYSRIIHLIVSKWGFVLMSIHIGLHGNMIKGMITKAVYITKPSKTRIVMFRIVMTLIAGYGIYAFFHGIFLLICSYKTNLFSLIMKNRTTLQL